jgi:hypothetical protein
MRKLFWSMALLAGIGLTACGGSSYTPGNTNPSPPPPTDTISGAVTFKGAPLAGVTVTLWMTNDNSIHGTATTDSNGAYSFTGISATGDVPGTYQLYALKTGYGFYPSVGAGAQVIRFDHTGQFQPGQQFAVPVYLTVIQFVATENNSVSNANFTAYDGTNAPVSIAATGQTQSYAAGDDGALRKGVAWPELRYTDNHNGTVTDQLTGLIWLKNAGCLTPAVWSAALDSANALASGACGLTDGSTAGQWRMPNLVELESLIDPSASSPALSVGNPFVNVSNGLYWSSTSYFGGDEGTFNAWAVRLPDGSYVNDGVLNLRASSINGVWAVRGAGSGQAKLQATGLYVPFHAGDDGTLQAGVGLIYPRFIEHNDGTVTDAMTGLTWLKMANCIHGDWATALSGVNNLASGQCGLSDGSTAGEWRMPNRNEMQSLDDRNQNNEADYLNYTVLNTDQSVFMPAVLTNFIEQQDYWTSTTDAIDTTQAWTVFSCDFGVYAKDKSQTGYTLAVR